MAKDLDYGLGSMLLSTTATVADMEFNTIRCRADGDVTFTEKYITGADQTHTLTMVAGQVFYGRFTVLTATGHIVAGR